MYLHRHKKGCLFVIYLQTDVASLASPSDIDPLKIIPKQEGSAAELMVQQLEVTLLSQCESNQLRQQAEQRLSMSATQLTRMSEEPHAWLSDRVHGSQTNSIKLGC